MHLCPRKTERHANGIKCTRCKTIYPKVVLIAWAKVGEQRGGKRYVIQGKACVWLEIHLFSKYFFLLYTFALLSSVHCFFRNYVHIPYGQAWALIRANTGIADPDLFIQKHLNCDQLEAQMMELKQASLSTSDFLPQQMPLYLPRTRAHFSLKSRTSREDMARLPEVKIPQLQQVIQALLASETIA